VLAADAGTVAAVTKSTDGVLIVVLRHDPQLLTVYANVTDLEIEKGDRVTRGQPIAKLRSGDASYVHFRVRDGGVDSVDPMLYLQ
jgi:murein DD-endopeptidase MepM/ murein hydrolase activator NlpD